MVVIIPPAISSFHFTRKSLIEATSATVSILLLSDIIRVFANMNSFHASMKQKTAVAAIPGADSGRIILVKALALVQPSILAASSSSLGIFLKNPLNNHIENGSEKTVYEIIKPVKESVN